MRIIEKKVYKFSELEKSVQEKVKDKYYEDFGAQDNSDDFEECANELLTLIGFKDSKVSYSLSYCQCDGLNFSFQLYADDIIRILTELKQNKSKEKGYVLLEDLQDKLYQIVKDVNIREKRIIDTDMIIYTEKVNTFYQHSRTNRIEFEIATKNGNKYASEIKDIFNEIYFTTCNFLEKEGYEQIYQQMDDVDFSEMAEVNEWEYFENGKRY